MEKKIFAPTSNSDDAGHATQYHKGSLDQADLLASPIDQFHKWFEEAQSHPVYQPETATFSTASLPEGKVSGRMVYMKELDARGFVIYSNWETSRKGRDARTNPYAALTFWWRESERQVRVEGPVERLTSEESQVYYDTRVRGSRIGAWASPQSQRLDGGRQELEQRVEEVERRFQGQDHIPLPPFWGGLRIVPDEMEFWQGRPNRLHDRFRYTKVRTAAAPAPAPASAATTTTTAQDAEATWKLERLSP